MCTTHSLKYVNKNNKKTHHTPRITFPSPTLNFSGGVFFVVFLPANNNFCKIAKHALTEKMKFTSSVDASLHYFVTKFLSKFNKVTELVFFPIPFEKTGARRYFLTVLNVTRTFLHNWLLLLNSFTSPFNNNTLYSLSLRFNSHFPGEPGLAGV